jgi:hypothetical protein
MQKTLVTLGGMYHGKVIPLLVSEFRIGRDSKCHLRPASTDISRLHCAITTRPDGRMFIRDFGSACGTIVNQRYLIGGELELHDGDVLEIGPLMFRFHVQAAMETSPASEATTAPMVPNPNVPTGPPPSPRPLLPGLTSVSSIPGRNYHEESALETTLETHCDLSDSNIFSVRDSSDFRLPGKDTLPLGRAIHTPGTELPDSGPKLVRE